MGSWRSSSTGIWPRRPRRRSASPARRVLRGGRRRRRRPARPRRRGGRARQRLHRAAPQPPAPPVRVVDRRDWAAANIDGLRAGDQPAGRAARRRQAAGRRSPTAIGSRSPASRPAPCWRTCPAGCSGSTRSSPPTRGQLLLVAPNIVEAERKLGADPRDFRLWVCLHEVTHRTQFTAVPWMRGHFLGEVGAFVDAGAARPGPARRAAAPRASARLADAVRDPDSRVSVLDLVQTPGQRAVLDRLTALMTLLEGHAEFVMDGVGPEVVPSVEEIRAKFNRRREGGNPLERVLRRLLGVDVKLRQYAEGRKFVHAVVERVGMDGLQQDLAVAADPAAPRRARRPRRLGRPGARRERAEPARRRPARYAGRDRHDRPVAGGVPGQGRGRRGAAGARADGARARRGDVRRGWGRGVHRGGGAVGRRGHGDHPGHYGDDDGRTRRRACCRRACRRKRC